jgi:hypothetical protein
VDKEALIKGVDTMFKIVVQLMSKKRWTVNQSNMLPDATGEDDKEQDPERWGDLKMSATYVMWKCCLCLEVPGCIGGLSPLNLSFLSFFSLFLWTNLKHSDVFPLSVMEMERSLVRKKIYTLHSSLPIQGSMASFFPGRVACLARKRLASWFELASYN